MKSFKGDMLTLIGQVDALCVTTNGFVKKNGECVMGRGIAKQIATIYPGLPRLLGGIINTRGNMVHPLFDDRGTLIISFPVKPISVKIETESDKCKLVAHMKDRIKVGEYAPGWAVQADIAIIKHSARQLSIMANTRNWQDIAIPRAGTGAGERRWADVKPVLDEYLDDRFIECTYN